MKMTINSDFILFGKELQRGFSTNFFHQWEDENPEHHAQLYINFTLGNDAIDGEEFAQEVFEVMRHAYFKDFERDPHERFEQALNEVNALAMEWRERKQVKFFSDIHAVIAIVSKSTMFITQCGMAEAYLLRKRHLTVISEGLADIDKDRDTLFVNVASGELEDYDTVVFSSVRLLRSVSKSDMAKIFTRDTSLARSFQVLREMVETDFDGRVNILALNIIHQGAEMAVQERSVVKSLNVGEKIKGLFAARNAPHESLRLRSQSKLPTISLQSLTDFSQFGKDKILVSLVLVIVVLVGGLFVVRTKSVNRQKLAQYEKTLTEVQESINEAETRGTFDKTTAIEMLSIADDKLKTVVDSGEYRLKSFELQDKIKEVRDRLDQIIQVKEPLLLANLAEKRSTVNAIGVLPFEDSLYAFEYNALYPILLDKLMDPLTIDQNEAVIDGVRSLDSKSLVFLTKSHKLLEFKDNFIEFLDTSDPAWKSGTAIDVYGDRLYMLDTADNSIWRYRKGRERYGSAEQYTTAGDLTDAVDIAIDGAVYVLKKDGTIVKYYAGEIDEAFSVLRQPMVPLTKPTKIFTEFEFNQVFILEPSEYRILVYNKDVKTGNIVYSHQYHFDSTLGEIKDMYFDKDANKLFVLTATKVYQVNQ